MSECELGAKGELGSPQLHLYTALPNACTEAKGISTFKRIVVDFI